MLMLGVISLCLTRVHNGVNAQVFNLSLHATAMFGLKL
jgi:hypothetical protein